MTRSTSTTTRSPRARGAASRTTAGCPEEFDHLRCLDARGPCIDGEGSGGSSLRIHDIWDYKGPHAASALGYNGAFDIGTTIDHFYSERGISFSGCAASATSGIPCRLHDSTFSLSQASTRAVFYLGKATPGGFRSDHNSFTRAASSGPGLVGSVFQVGGVDESPTDFSSEDDVFTAQGAGWTLFQSIGAVGVRLWRDVLTTASGGYVAWDAEGSGANDGTSGVRTTGLVLQDVGLVGPFSAAMTIDGGRAGVGTLSLTGSVALSAVRGLVCTRPNPAPGVVGISGPIVYSGNTMPAPSAACPISP